MDEENKSIDGVAKPGSTPPDSSSKPLVVSHAPMVKDPTITDNEEKPDEDLLNQGTKKVIEPLNATEQEQTEPEAPGVVVQETIVEKTTQTNQRSSNSGSSSSSEKRSNNPDQDQQARKQEIEELVDSKEYFVKVKEPKKKRKRKLVVLLVLVVTSVFGVLLAADAGYINLPFDLPFDLIKNDNKDDSNQTTQTTPVSNSKTDDNTTTATDQPANPKGFVEYQNSDYKFSFAYPENWGKLEPSEKGEALFAVTGPLFEDKQSEVQGRLSVYVYGGSQYSTVLSKYGPLLEFVSGKWQVKNPNSEVNEQNSKYKVGDVVEVCSTKNESVEVYDFSFGDEGCQVTRMVFRAGDNFVEISTPSLCGQDLTSANQKNIQSFNSTKEQIIKSIKVTTGN